MRRRIAVVAVAAVAVGGAVAGQAVAAPKTQDWHHSSGYSNPDHCFVAKLSMQNDPHGYFDVRPDDQPCYNDGGVSWHFDWAWNT
ncbi:hypothetical protein GCM10029964_125960 [Kibdelosporangium lantanae]